MRYTSQRLRYLLYFTSALLLYAELAASSLVVAETIAGARRDGQAGLASAARHRATSLMCQ